MDQFRLFPPQASTTSHEVDALFFALTLISLFFMAVIFLPIIFFSVKYRRGSPADRSNPRSGSFLIESGWTIGPIFLSLGLFAWGAVAYFRIEQGQRTRSTWRSLADNGCGNFNTQKANERSTNCTCRSIAP